MNENVVLLVDYEKICRLCLHTTGAMSDLFVNNKGNTLKDMVLRATGLEVNQHDGFPNKICHKCRYIVELNCELRDMVSQTNNLLVNADNLNTVEEHQQSPETVMHKPDQVINEENPEIRLIMQENGVMTLMTSEPGPDNPADLKPENTDDLTRSSEDTVIEDGQKHIKRASITKIRMVAPKHLTCQICLTTVHTIQDVISHVDSHYPDSGLTPYTQLQPPFKCELCKRRVSKKQLILHHRSHLDINPLKCKETECGFIGKSVVSLRCHLDTHSTRTQVCEVCGASYKRRCELRQHTLREHRSGPAHCWICRKRFRNIVTLRGHLQQYHKPRRFKCEWAGCGKAYHSFYALSVHARGHNDERTYRCHLCDHAAYTSQSQLNRHLRMHRRPRMSKCDRCSETFDDYGAFYKHRITHHGPWLPYRCQGCNKRYQMQPKLKVHMKTCKLALAIKEENPTDENTQLDSIQEIIDSENKMRLEVIHGGRSAEFADKFRTQSLLVQPGNTADLSKEFELQDISPGGLLYIEVDPEDEDVNSNEGWQH